MQWNVLRPDPDSLHVYISGFKINENENEICLPLISVHDKHFKFSPSGGSFQEARL